MEVKNQLETVRKNRELMEVHLVRDKKLLKESVMALISYLQNSKNDLPASIINTIANSTTSNETSSASLMNDNWLLEDLRGKQNQELEMQKELDNLNFEKKNLETAIYDCNKFRSLCDEKDEELKAALTKKRNLEIWLSKLSSQVLKKNIPKELVEANNQVFEKIYEALQARTTLCTAEETKKTILSEKTSLEAKIIELEKKKSSEDNTCII